MNDNDDYSNSYTKITPPATHECAAPECKSASLGRVLTPYGSSQACSEHLRELLDAHDARDWSLAPWARECMDRYVRVSTAA
jgi:hypothetical protein